MRLQTNMFNAENSTNTAIAEKDLIIPILLVLAHAKNQKLEGLATPQIRDAVTRAMVASPDDLKVTSSGEVRLERQARNAISSHKTLQKKGFAEMQDGLTHITLEGQKKLVEFFVLAMQGEAQEEGIDVPSDFNDLPTLSEGELVAPALMELVKAEINGSGPVSTAKLITGIQENVPMGKSDMEKIPSGDVRNERLIRNLKSHKTLVSKGYATEMPEGLKIAQGGWEHLLSVYLEITPSPDFTSSVPRKSPKL